jgi:hypothetical protein
MVHRLDRALTFGVHGLHLLSSTLLRALDPGTRMGDIDWVTCFLNLS